MRIITISFTIGLTCANCADAESPEVNTAPKALRFESQADVNSHALTSDPLTAEIDPTAPEYLKFIEEATQAMGNIGDHNTRVFWKDNTQIATTDDGRLVLKSTVNAQGWETEDIMFSTFTTQKWDQTSEIEIELAPKWDPEAARLFLEAQGVTASGAGLDLSDEVNEIVTFNVNRQLKDAAFTLPLHWFEQPGARAVILPPEASSGNSTVEQIELHPPAMSTTE